MIQTRLDAGFSGVIAFMACLACTSLEDLSSYSAGSAGSAGESSFPPPVAVGNDESATPAPDAGPVAPPAVEAQDPTDVSLLPSDGVAVADDCSGPGEFASPSTTSCYLLGDVASAWRDARSFCEAWGGDLAEIESVEEHTLLSQQSDDDVWIGANDLDDEGNFRWTNGSVVDPEGPWAPGQPDNYEGREDCLELRNMDEAWNDTPCMSEKRALCERAIGRDAGAP